MKTLLIYYSDDELVCSLCRKSASRELSVCELHELSGLSYFKRFLNSIKGAKVPVSSCGYDLNEFDCVILAADGRIAGLSPEMRSFLKGVTLKNKRVYCVIFGDVKRSRRAEDDFRTAVSLSGATVQRAVTVPVKAFKRDDEDMMYFIRHKVRVC